GITSSWRLAASQKGRVNAGLSGLGRGFEYSVAIAFLPCLLCGLRAKYERAHHARGTPSTVDHCQVVLGDLALPGPAHNLAGRLDHVSETPGPAHRLATRYLAAVSVHGEAALVGRIDGIKKRANLALLAEASIFEAHGREDGISIVEFGELYILWPIAGHLIGLTGRNDDRRSGHPGALPDRIVVAGTRPSTQQVYGWLGK